MADEQQQQQTLEAGSESNNAEMISSRPSSSSNHNDDTSERVSPSPTPSVGSNVSNDDTENPLEILRHEDEDEDHEIKKSPLDPTLNSNSDKENSKSPILSFPHLPILRLNAALASDPASNPDAKDLKNIVKEETLKEQNAENITIPINVDLPPRLAVYMCGPCGIRFSSASTLSAHQTYYCSHRKDADENNGGGKHGTNDPNGTEPPNKAVKTGKQYACSQCSYSADKKVSLNRHMRMHQSSPAPSSTASNGDEQQLPAQQPPSQIQIQIPVQPQQQIDRYCSDCDIRFSSTKTYRAHKQHYCSSRHREGGPTNSVPVGTAAKANTQKSGSQSPPEVAKTPPVVSPQQPFLALPTNPIIIIPYALFRGAGVISVPL